MNINSHRYRVFVLGAGFSRPAGLPLAAELWREVRRRANLMYGRASKFNDDLETYIEFRKDCDGLRLTPRKVNFEDFIAFLDIEHHLGFRGSDTWSEDGNESQVIIKTLIGRILTEHMPQAKDLPEIYLRFAEALQPDDYVITFNYDVVPERALDIVGKPFRLFPFRYKSVHPGHAEVDDSVEEVIVLKVHGSIDWFDRRKYRKFSELRLRQGLTSPTPDPVFNNPDLTVVPLVSGPRFPDDPLREMHRVLQIERLHPENHLFRATPTLLSPSTMKILYSDKVKEFWRGFGGAGMLNLGLAIIGFSLPEQDNYARQAIYRLVKNYQCANEDIESLGQKSPLVIIDLRRSKREKEEFKRRYAFVDWSRAISYFNGFDKGALQLIVHQSQKILGQADMEVLLKSGKLTVDQIIQALRDFTYSSNCWTYMPEESAKYTSLVGYPACMIMLDDKEVCLIVAVAKNENGTYYVSNIIPKESGSLLPTEYNKIAKRFAESVEDFTRKSHVPLRVSLLIETLDLKHIISSPIARKSFDQYLAMYPRSYHPADIRRLDMFVCVASRLCRKPINLDKLEAYLRVKLQWSDEDSRWCRQRIETGFEILRINKKF